MVKTGGFASPDFSGFAPCFMTCTLSGFYTPAKLTGRMCAAAIGGRKILMNGIYRG
jgi:hypothetical protein